MGMVLPAVFLPLGPPGWRDKRDYIDKLQPGYLGSRYHNSGIPANWDGSVVKSNLLHLTKLLRYRQSKPAWLTQSRPMDPFDYRPSQALLLISVTHPVVLYTFIPGTGTQAFLTRVLQWNRENREHQKYFWNVIVLQERSQSGVRKLNRKQKR